MRWRKERERGKKIFTGGTRTYVLYRRIFYFNLPVKGYKNSRISGKISIRCIPTENYRIQIQYGSGSETMIFIIMLPAITTDIIFFKLNKPLTLSPLSVLRIRTAEARTYPFQVGVQKRCSVGTYRRRIPRGRVRSRAPRCSGHTRSCRTRSGARPPPPRGSPWDRTVIYNS